MTGTSRTALQELLHLLCERSKSQEVVRRRAKKLADDKALLERFEQAQKARHRVSGALGLGRRRELRDWLAAVVSQDSEQLSRAQTRYRDAERRLFSWVKALLSQDAQYAAVSTLCDQGDHAQLITTGLVRELNGAIRAVSYERHAGGLGQVDISTLADYSCAASLGAASAVAEVNSYLVIFRVAIEQFLGVHRIANIDPSGVVLANHVRSVATVFRRAHFLPVPDTHDNQESLLALLNAAQLVLDQLNKTVRQLKQRRDELHLAFIAKAQGDACNVQPAGQL